jgi:hypothetical protein
MNASTPYTTTSTPTSYFNLPQQQQMNIFGVNPAQQMMPQQPQQQFNNPWSSTPNSGSLF